MLIRLIWFLGIVTFAIEPASAASTETTPFELVQGFVLHLGTFENDRARMVNDLAADPKDYASCIRNNTTFQLDLRNAISFFRGAKLPASNLAKDIPSGLADILQQKLTIVGDLTRVCEALLVEDPKTDYAALAKNTPKLTALSEYTDKSLFPAAAGIFMTLISQRPDSQNHLSHMSITRAERDSLLKDLRSFFGAKLDMTGDQIPYYIFIAQLYRDKLKEFKCMDDPWE